MNNIITLDQGGGGKEMHDLLQSFLPVFFRGQWENGENDGATFSMKNVDMNSLVFTTDSYVVSPYKFPGGDIGHLAFSGTVNDLVVMGADPVGLSLSLIIEEGFSRADLENILKSIQHLSTQFQIPIVTGDTKIMERGAVDGIVINTSGIGFAGQLLNGKLEVGDKIIISGGIGEHGVALLSQRFDFDTEIVSDSKPLVDEMKAIRCLLKCSKDPTRAGLAAALNEVAESQGVAFEIWEKSVPIQKPVRSACDMLGIDPFVLANEGKVVCFVATKDAESVVEKLREFNAMAEIIGEVKEVGRGMSKVVLKTEFGSRILGMPSGKIVPRIC